MKIAGKEIKGFLFDLDGVLIDSEREYTKIWQKIENEYPTGIEDFAVKIKGTNLENILSTYYPDESVRENVRRRLYEEEAKMVYDYCDGARDFLMKLKDASLPMALYTSSDSYKMSHLYRDRPELREMFGAVVLGDMVSRSKPDPEGYLKAAELLGLDPKDCVVAEDSLQGVKAGKEAGSVVVGIAGTLPPYTLEPYCDIVVENLSEL